MLCNLRFPIIFLIKVKTSLLVNFVSYESTTRVKRGLLSLDQSIFNTQLTNRAIALSERCCCGGGAVVSTTINHSNFIFFNLGFLIVQKTYPFLWGFLVNESFKPRKYIKYTNHTQISIVFLVSYILQCIVQLLFSFIKLSELLLI